jgi:NADH dehydrogenase
MRRSTILALGAGSLMGFGAARACRRNHKVKLSTQGRQVVVLGGGFGGLSAASRLVQMAGDQLHVTLVDQHNYHLFTPMLYQVATCGVVPYDVAIPLRSFTGPHGIRFRRGTVQGVDLKRGSCKLTPEP